MAYVDFSSGSSGQEQNRKGSEQHKNWSGDFVVEMGKYLYARWVIRLPQQLFPFDRLPGE